jgi:hypothetical protein
VEGRHGCRGEDRRHGDGTSSFRPTGKTASTRNCHFAAKVVLAASPDKIAATIKKPGVENVLLPFVFLLYYHGPLVCASVQRREGRARSLAQSRSRPWMFQHASARTGDERRRQHRVLSACRPLDKIISFRSFSCFTIMDPWCVPVSRDEKEEHAHLPSLARDLGCSSMHRRVEVTSDGDSIEYYLLAGRWTKSYTEYRTPV